MAGYTYAVSNNIPYEILNPNTEPEIYIIDDITYYVGNGESTLMKCPTDKAGAATILSEVGGFPVTKINNDAFSECAKITSVTIPDTVTSMADSTFYGCSTLTEVKLPASLQEVPTYAFYNCTSLRKIEIPANVRTIVGSAFSNCSNLQEVILNEGLTKIDRYAFGYCTSLKAISLLQTLTTLGDSSFYGCKSLQEIAVPGKITSMGDGIFYQCTNLMKATFADTVNIYLEVTEKEAWVVGTDGVNTDEEYLQQQIEDIAGDEKELGQYYDITMSKSVNDSEIKTEISDIQCDTDTTGKMRITMEIPEEYRGHKHYQFVHIHNGEVITLVDLDDDLNTITFETDKFLTYALLYDDIDDVSAEKGSITAQNGKYVVSSDVDALFYIAKYDGKKLISITKTEISAGTTDLEFDILQNSKAFLWDMNMNPVCDNVSQ